MATSILTTEEIADLKEFAREDSVKDEGLMFYSIRDKEEGLFHANELWEVAEGEVNEMLENSGDYIPELEKLFGMKIERVVEGLGMKNSERFVENAIRKFINNEFAMVGTD